MPYAPGEPPPYVVMLLYAKLLDELDHMYIPTAPSPLVVMLAPVKLLLLELVPKFRPLL
ncbi:Uncharacterised protein [uncultured archaeon]|nr:Uncharacterised protein [uncultured archaeon]